MQPTSLRSWVSGREFRTLVVLQAMAVGRSRSAADAIVKPTAALALGLTGRRPASAIRQSGLARSARGGLTCGWNGPGRAWLAALAARPGRSSAALLGSKGEKTCEQHRYSSWD